MVKTAEQKIENEKKHADRGEEPRPAHRHEMVIQILKDLCRDSLRNHHTPAELDAPKVRPLPRVCAGADPIWSGVRCWV
jgi:hypothetical protein